jgi:hypothetical protein
MPLIIAGRQARQLAAMQNDRAPAGGGGPIVPEQKDLADPGDQRDAVPPAAAGRDCRPARHFSRQPLSFAQVHTIVASAFAAHRRDWPPAVHGDPALVILLAAFGITELRWGMYGAVASGHDAFVALPDTRLLPELRRQYGDAPALLHICGDLGSASQTSGSGYGALLVRAGALGQSAWLSAVSEGLAGATYGQASHRVTQAARLAGPGLRHLMTVAIGVPPPAGTGPPGAGVTP